MDRTRAVGTTLPSLRRRLDGSGPRAVPDPLIRVAIVEGEPEALTTTTEVIDAEPDLAVVGSGSSAPEALELARRLRPAVLMLDLSVAGGRGEAVTRSILEASTQRPAVLAVTSEATDDEAFGAIRAGVAGVCAKSDAPQVLVDSVREVAAGKGVLSPPLAGKLLRRLGRPRPKELARCSAREVEVLQLVAEGANNAEIAANLYISQTTVRSHVQSLRTKLGVRDRIGLVVFAHKGGLLREV